jgi:hypothetical protein
MGMGGELRRVGGREEDAGGVGEEDEDEARNILRPGGTVAVGWAGWGAVGRRMGSGAAPRAGQAEPWKGGD